MIYKNAHEGNAAKKIKPQVAFGRLFFLPTLVGLTATDILDVR
jgi:hypothetical protein